MLNAYISLFRVVTFYEASSSCQDQEFSPRANPCNPSQLPVNVDYLYETVILNRSIFALYEFLENFESNIPIASYYGQTGDVEDRFEIISLCIGEAMF